MASLAERKAAEAKAKAEAKEIKAVEEESKRSAVISVAAINDRQRKNRDKKRAADSVDKNTAKEIKAASQEELIEMLDVYNARAKRSINNTSTLNTHELVKLELARRLSFMSSRDILMRAVDGIIWKHLK